jgi:hypothetical protein
MLQGGGAIAQAAQIVDPPGNWNCDWAAVALAAFGGSACLPRSWPRNTGATWIGKFILFSIRCSGPVRAFRFPRQRLRYVRRAVEDESRMNWHQRPIGMIGHSNWQMVLYGGGKD